MLKAVHGGRHGNEDKARERKEWEVMARDKFTLASQEDRELPSPTK